MSADHNVFCIIQRRFYLFVRSFVRYRTEYLFQSSCPCIFCFFQCDFCISKCEFRIICHFTDHSVRDGEFSYLVCRNFCYDITECRCKKFSCIHAVFDLHTHSVTECHLADSCDHSMAVKCVSRYDLSVVDIISELTVLIHYLFIYRQLVFIFFNLHPYKLITCFFQFRSNDISFFGNINCKGYQCRRYIDMFKCSGHAVLSSDWRKSVSNLCLICTKQCCKWLTPSFRILCHSAEIFLECKTDLAVISTTSHDLSHRLCDSIDSSVIRTPAWQIRIKSITHHRNGIAFTMHNRKLCNHTLRLCHLVFSTVRHENRACSNGSVEHLNQTFLRAYIQIFQSIQPFFFYIANLNLFLKDGIFSWRNINFNRCFLVCTVGVQEGTGNIYNLFSSPWKNKSRIFGNNCNLYRLQILFFCIAKEFIYILRIYHNSHTLLGFRNCNLCSVKTCIFFRYFVQIDLKTICKFSDCNRYSACSEVITLLDQLADFFSAEHSLDFTFGRRITLLNLSSTCLDGFFGMNFGRTGCSTTAITSGTSAKKNDDISRIRIFTDNCTSRSSTHNRTDLHSLCHIIRMIDLFYQSGCKSDLITIWAVSMCCTTHQFLLRQFSFHRLFYRYGRICCAGYTHCLVYISTSWQWITDCSSKTCCSSTKWFDFCRMVMCLILEVDQPLFFYSVNLNRNNDTAGIDLIGFFLILKFAFFFQLPHCHQCKIHQAYKFVFASFKDLTVCLKVFFISIFHRLSVIAITEGYFCKFCWECSMTAVVRPVSIQNTDLCHRWISVFLPFEIILDVLEILECHSKSKRTV